MKIIITGVEGFIGKHLAVTCLNYGHEVYGVGLDENKVADLITNEHFSFLKASFDEYSSLADVLPKNADCFYHFAWNGVFGEAFKDYEKQLLNCKYSCDALMIAKKINCKKFILASTINVLETRKYFSMSSISPRYTNIYATAKLSSEMMCKTLAYQNGIEFNCGLIAMVYGENNGSRMIPNVILENLLKSKETNLIEANTPYDLIYVNDVAEAFLAIGEKGINQKTYYVGHSKISTFGEIFSKIRDIVNKDGVLNFGAFKETNCIDYSLISTDELEKDTGFKASSDFEKSILSTAEWLKSTF